MFCIAIGAAPVRAAPYAAMVMDARTGEVLHSRNADTRLHPASLTKMMTLYIAFEAVRLGEITMDTRVRVSQAAASEPYAIGFRAGSTVVFRYLVRAAAIRSSNDAATAIAEAIEGSEAAFARRMNRTALALGMTRTTFRNAHGLTENGHLSTARDMTILGRRLFYDYPQYYNIFSRRSTDAGIATVRNTNRAVLNAYEGADGIKTGYTRAAGFNLVASAQRGQERILATVFGGRSAAWRNQRIMELFDMGFARAPSRAQVRVPGLPTYPDEPSSGTTTRPTGAVTRSIRPVPRPSAEPAPELLAAISEAVGEALDNVQDEPTAAAERDAEAAAAIANAARAALTDQPTTVPIPRPEPQAALQTAAVPEVVDVASAAEPPAPTPPVETPATTVVAETLPAPTPPAPRDTTETMVANATPLADVEVEVVMRASSSGSRLYGVSLGLQNTHHAAERLLLRTALAEIGTFDDALRRVVRTNAGFDARFQGMTEEEASRACARLGARNVPCETFGPG